MSSPSAQQGGFHSGEFAPVSYGTESTSYRKVKINSPQASGGSRTDNGCFAVSGGKIINAYCRCAREMVTCTNNGTFALPSGSASSYVYVVLSHATGGSISASLASGSSIPSNTGDNTYVPIYKVTGGSVVVDYRNMPSVPFYE